MSTACTALPVVIRPASEADLPILAAQFAPESRASDHARRFAIQQQGEGRYLIAWYRAEPVGHFLVRWHGTDYDPTGQYPAHAAYLGAGQVKPTYRRRGVGTRMIREAEHDARTQGCAQIGLTVGSRDNPQARRLYERLGYRDWGRGEFGTRWEYETADGSTAMQSGICIYMVKALAVIAEAADGSEIPPG